MTGPQARTDPARVLDHEAVLACADRILVTAHPSESLASVALRAGEAALEAYLGGAWDGCGAVATDPLRRLLARHLGERLPDDHAGELRAAVTAAAVVTALDLALAPWLAGGAGGNATDAGGDGTAACRERFRAVAPLLPPEPGPA